MRLKEELSKSAKFSDTEKIIANYILEHPEQIEYLSTRQLAELTFTSPATVVRLCKKVGTKGFPDFKLKYLNENCLLPQCEEIPRKDPITDKDTISSIAKKIASLERDAIIETKCALDIKQLERVYNLIENANSVDFYAFDNNLKLAQITCVYFMYTGKNVSIGNSDDSQYLQAINSSPDNVAIIISRTGSNKKLMNIAKVLKKKNIKIIVLTNSKEAPLVKYADEHLLTCCEEAFLDLGSAVFTVSVKYILDVLFGILVSKNYSKTLKITEVYDSIYKEVK